MTSNFNSCEPRNFLVLRFTIWCGGGSHMNRQGGGVGGGRATNSSLFLGCTIFAIHILILGGRHKGLSSQNYISKMTDIERLLKKIMRV